MNRQRKKSELLAPAGDLERLKFAIRYGADAVYFGGSAFGLRANAINFSLEDIKEAVSFAHERGKRVYVTVNIVLHQKEVSSLCSYLQELDHLGVDAIIVSDPAVITLAREHTSLEIHLSTQQSTLNHKAIAFWKKQGVTRIVLGREASKTDIESIRKQSDIELETFIHGAMCSAYSGRCVLSNFFTARDANRGGCSQICRWDFSLLNEDKKELSGEKAFTFCTKDLSMLRYLDQMIELGIDSFKIEGRMRSVYYIATVVSIYRKAIDRYFDEDTYEYDIEDERRLRSCANRDAVPQFFQDDFGTNCQYYNGREEISNQDFLGIVMDYDSTSKIMTLEERNYFKVGDEVEIFGPNTPYFSFCITKMWDEDGAELDIARHPKQILRIKVDHPVQKYDMMKIKGGVNYGEK